MATVRRKSGSLQPGEGEQVGQVWLSAPSSGFPYFRLTYVDQFGAKQRKTAGRDYKNARNRAQEVDAALTAGLEPQTSTTTFATAWASWLELKCPTISLEYQTQLDRAMRTKLKPLARTNLKDLRYQHIQSLLDQMRIDGATSATQKRLISQVRPFLKWAHQEKLLPRSSREYLERLVYADPIQYVKVDSRRGGLVLPEDVFSMTEVYALAQAVWKTTGDKLKRQKSLAKDWDYPTFARSTELAFLLQASTGLRQGELRAVELRDFKKDAGAGSAVFPEFRNLTVERQYREHAGGFKEIRRPKNAKVRTIFVPAWTAPTDSHNGEPRKAAEVLAKYGIVLPEATTEKHLVLAKSAALNRFLVKYDWLVDPRTVRGDLSNLRFWELPNDIKQLADHEKISWVDQVDRIFWEQDNKFFYRSESGETTELVPNRFGPLPELGASNMQTQFIELFDDGQIKPLRELLNQHFKALKTKDHGFWGSPHTDNLEVEDLDHLLLWASLRPPRIDTRLPINKNYLNPNGAHVSYTFLRTYWNEIVANSKIDNRKKSNGQARSMRNLRHTFATQALRTGTPVPTVAQQLGHADPSITLQRYTKIMTPGAATPIAL